MEKMTRRIGGILLGERQSSVFNRMIAKGIDILLVVAILLIGKAVWAPFGIGLALFICAFQDGFGEGQSVGKRIMGLCVINLKTGQPCSYMSSFIRNVPFMTGVLMGALPVLWIFFPFVAIPVVVFEVFMILMLDTGVRLGDVMGKTLVVEFEGGRPPEA